MSCNWEKVRLKDIVSFKTGKIDSNAADEGGIYPFFTCSPTTLAINEYAFDTEAVLLAGNNANGVFSVKHYEGKFNAYQRTYVITPLDRSVVSVKWLYFRIKHVTAELQQMSVGTATKFLTKKILDAYEVDLPSFEKQEEQAKILWSLQHKFDLNSRANQTLEEMAQAIFKSWFVDFDPVKAKIRGDQPEGMDADTASMFPEKLVESELGLIPEGWGISTLSSLIKLTGGGTPKRSEDTYWNGDIPWFSVKDVPSGSDVFVVDTNENITVLGLNKSSTKLLQKGTTIITARGTVGKLALVGTDMCMNQSCYGIRGEKVGDFYNYFNLKQAVTTLQQNTHGAVFDTITTKTFETYSLAFSGVELANKFDELITPILQKVEANVRQNIELSTLRDTLLPKLLSGELELNIAETSYE